MQFFRLSQKKKYNNNNNHVKWTDGSLMKIAITVATREKRRGDADKCENSKYDEE